MSQPGEKLVLHFQRQDWPKMIISQLSSGLGDRCQVGWRMGTRRSDEVQNPLGNSLRVGYLPINECWEVLTQIWKIQKFRFLGQLIQEKDWFSYSSIFLMLIIQQLGQSDSNLYFPYLHSFPIPIGPGLGHRFVTACCIWKLNQEFPVHPKPRPRQS